LHLIENGHAAKWQQSHPAPEKLPGSEHLRVPLSKQRTPLELVTDTAPPVQFGINLP